MGFQYLWPLGLLILIPVIIIMYLLKQKTEPHPFSSLFLWSETYRNLHSDAPWEKLKKSLLMAVQILTLIALIIALMSPYIRSKHSGTGHVIVVIDNSASMKTKYDNSSTRLQVAIDNAVRYVEGLRAGTSVSVISSNREAVLLLSDSADKSLAIRRIKDITPTNFAGSCEAGSNMVRSMVMQWESCEVVYFTDSAVVNGFGDATGQVVDVYSDTDNALIEYVGHGKNADGSYTILAKITNNTKDPLTCEVNLYGDDKIIDVSPALNIASGKSDILYFEKVNFNGKTVCVELNNVRDALEDDNKAYDVITEIKDCNTLLMTYQNLYLEKAVGLVNGVKITKAEKVSEFEAYTAADNYDLFIFDGMLPEKLPETGNILLINAFDGDLCKATDKLGGVRVYTEDSKLTGYLEEYSFGVSQAVGIDCPYWADKFLTTRANDKEYVLGCFGSQNGRTVCMLGFDFHDSELPLKLEFPILIHNIMSVCAGTGILQSTVVNTGASIQINGGAAGLQTLVESPSGQKTSLSGSLSVFGSTDEIGVYSVSRTGDGTTVSEVFAVNFPKTESVINQKPTESTGTDNIASANTVATSSLNLRTLVICFILILLAAEWFVYIRGL